MEIRLNRFIAQSGYCSRRKADSLIKEGKVKVNGLVVSDLGVKINPAKDVVEIDGQIIRRQTKPVYIKLYKPRGYLTALGKDRFGKKTLTDLFQEIGLKEKVFPVGRLDYDSEGLLILTNDGDFANILVHPKYEVKKVYHLKLSGSVDTERLERFKRGTYLEDGFFKPDMVKVLTKGKDFTWVSVVIHSGKKRILRRFFGAFGHTVLRLIRVKVGNIELDNLKPGQFNYIPQPEIRRLIKMVLKDEERNYLK